MHLDFFFFGRRIRNTQGWEDGFQAVPVADITTGHDQRLSFHFASQAKGRGGCFLLDLAVCMYIYFARQDDDG